MLRSQSIIFLSPAPFSCPPTNYYSRAKKRRNTAQQCIVLMNSLFLICWCFFVAFSITAFSIFSFLDRCALGLTSTQRSQNNCFFLLQHLKVTNSTKNNQKYAQLIGSCSTISLLPTYWLVSIRIRPIRCDARNNNSANQENKQSKIIETKEPTHTNTDTTSDAILTQMQIHTHHCTRLIEHNNAVICLRPIKQRSCAWIESTCMQIRSLSFWSIHVLYAVVSFQTLLYQYQTKVLYQNAKWSYANYAIYGTVLRQNDSYSFTTWQHNGPYAHTINSPDSNPHTSTFRQIRVTDLHKQYTFALAIVFNPIVTIGICKFHWNASPRVTHGH